jgi:hypothetical protein
MKTFKVLIVLLFLISCNKDPEPILFYAGSGTDVTVTDYDSTAQGTYVNTISDEHDFIIDLDADGVNDIQFISRKDTNYTSGTDNFVNNIYTLQLKIINANFSVAEIKGSQKTYIHYSEPEYDYYGTFPRKTVTVNYSCDSLPNSNESTSLSTIKYLEFSTPINQSLQWKNNGYEIMIHKTKYSNRTYASSIGGDSLIGELVINDTYCNSMPQNINYFIPFKKNLGNQAKYGWILMDITQNNKITVYKSVIQNEYN